MLKNKFVANFLRFCFLLAITPVCIFAQQTPEVKRTDALLPQTSRSKLLLGSELDQSLDRAKRRLNDESQSYSNYLASRIRLEKELKQAMASELRTYELQLIEVEGSKAQSELEKRSASLLEGLQTFIKEQQSAVNADVLAYETAVLAYETARRKQAFQLIAEREASIREHLQSLQNSSSQAVESQVSKLLKERSAVLQVNLSKHLRDLDKDYFVKGYVAPDKNDQARGESSAAKAVVSPITTAALDTSATEWEVTTADSTLRSLLSRWAERAKWTLVWGSDIDLAINANTTFKSTMPKAIESVMDTLVSEKDRLTIGLYEKNKVINVQRRY